LYFLSSSASSVAKYFWAPSFFESSSLLSFLEIAVLIFILVF
jgi:zinc finger CCCH domain-containing protein 13